LNVALTSPIPCSWLNCARHRQVCRPPGTGMCAADRGPYTDGVLARSTGRAPSATGTKRNSEISSGWTSTATQARGIGRTAGRTESHATRPALPRPEEVDTGKPPGVDLDSALLSGLPPGRPPTVSLRLPRPARQGSSNPPCRSVSDEQPAGHVEDESAGRCRDLRDLITPLLPLHEAWHVTILRTG